DDHKELLAEKGFLSEDFKPMYKIGYWLREMEETFETARFAAVANGRNATFYIQAKAGFNHQIDEVKFHFRYEYSPKTDSLKLKSLVAQMGPKKKTYFLHRNDDLPHANDVYNYLSKRFYRKMDDAFFQKMENSLKNKKVL